MENFLNSFTRVQGMFSIYMGKPVAFLYLTVWANGKKDSELVNSFRKCVYHLHKPVPFPKKCPRKPETGIKDSFSDVRYLQEIFFWNDTKSIINLLFNRNFQKLFVYGKTNKLARPSENKNRNYPVYENVVWKR